MNSANKQESYNLDDKSISASQNSGQLADSMALNVKSYNLLNILNSFHKTHCIFIVKSFQEVNSAYDVLKDIDVLDLSREGVEAWENSLKM